MKLELTAALEDFLVVLDGQAEGSRVELPGGDLLLGATGADLATKFMQPVARPRPRPRRPEVEALARERAAPTEGQPVSLESILWAWCAIAGALGAAFSTRRARSSVARATRPRRRPRRVPVRLAGRARTRGRARGARRRSPPSHSTSTGREDPHRAREGRVLPSSCFAEGRPSPSSARESATPRERVDFPVSRTKTTWKG